MRPAANPPEKGMLTTTQKITFGMFIRDRRYEMMRRITTRHKYEVPMLTTQLGISVKTFYEIEQGKREPSFAVWILLRRILRIRTKDENQLYEDLNL